MNTDRARSWQQEYIQPQERQKKVIVRVKKKSWLTKGEKIIYTFFGILLLIASIYIVSFSSSVDSLNRNVQTLETQLQQQKLENENLIFEVSELSKPERIINIAKDNGLKIQEAEVIRAVKLNE